MIIFDLLKFGFQFSVNSNHLYHDTISLNENFELET